jgi:hypothetical protein
MQKKGCRDRKQTRRYTLCQAEMEQAREVRVQEEDRVQGREWEERRVAVDHRRVRQDTVCVLNAASKLLIRSVFPAADRAARNAAQK